MPDAAEAVKREERCGAFPAILCFLARGDLQLHSAAVEIDGGAVVIAAPQIHGKTTFAAMCHNAGFRILSEDATCIRDLTSPHVIPGPAVLRLRRATAERIEITGAREVTERDHRLISRSIRNGGATVARFPSVRSSCSARARPASASNDRNPLTPSADLWPLSFNLPRRPIEHAAFRPLRT